MIGRHVGGSSSMSFVLLYVARAKVSPRSNKSCGFDSYERFFC